ncbi:hypothetical protein E2C01_062289 [Portunus trituberculatus]|uniref:Uncharacterized protein n=1 Tax=Portunus trituberculatus TaxID=210409 RepID=A0A5B7HFP3_PORTR|nr:hypothetical protein [Portunus trituberculatus]
MMERLGEYRWCLREGLWEAGATGRKLQPHGANDPRGGHVLRVLHGFAVSRAAEELRREPRAAACCLPAAWPAKSYTPLHDLPTSQ